MAKKGLHRLTVQEANNAKLGQAGSVFIDDTAGITPFEMRNRVKEFIREREQYLLEKWNLEHGDAESADLEEIRTQAKPRMVMVDYLQLMSGSNPSEGRVQEI